MKDNQPDCLNNLEICQASCCKWIFFDFKILPIDVQNYYKYHGCKIIKRKDRTIRVLIPLRCNMLDENNKCKLHNTPDKPFACNNLSETTKHKYQLTEGCILK